MAKMTMTLSTIVEHMHVIGSLGKHIMVIATNVPPFYKTALLSLQRRDRD